MENFNSNIMFTLGIGNIGAILNQIEQVNNAFKAVGKDSPLLKNLSKDISNVRQTYSEQINKMTKETEELYRLWKSTGDVRFKNQFDSLAPSLKQLNQEYRSFNNQIKDSSNNVGALGKAFERVKSHASWLLAGTAIAAGVGLPLALMNDLKNVEVLTNKIKQNLEMKFEGNATGLNAEAQKLQEIAGIFAVGYGVEYDKVLEVIGLLSRRFKDVNEIVTLTNSALVMNKIDFIDATDAAQKLEAMLLQFGLSVKDSKTFLNDLNTVIHSTNINAKNLMDALERSSSSFHSMNMSSREAMAAVASLSTETAASGSRIGNMFKSVAANFDFKKATEALEAYNIKLYEVNETGTKTMRKGANIFGELINLFGKLDDEGQRKLAYSIAGGKYHVNQLLAFLEDANGNFQRILSEINEKSSDALSASLLKLGLETWQTKLNSLQASLEVLGVTLANDVAPALKKVTDGLTEGVVFLTEHSNEVRNLIKALTALAGAVAYYYAQQAISNKLVAEGTLLLRAMYLCEGNFVTAFAGMGNSLKSFGGVVLATSLQVMGLLALIQAAIEAKDALTQYNNEKKYEDDPEIQVLKAKREELVNMPGSGAFTSRQITEINDQIRSKITEKKSAEGTTAQAKVQAAVQAAFEKIQNAQLPEARIPTMTNQIADKPGHTSNGSAYAPDKSKEIFRLDTTHDVNHLLSQAKIAADAYSEAIDKLTTKEQNFGIKVETSSEKLNLMNKRVLDLTATAMEYTSIANEFEDQSQGMIEGNQELKAQLDAQKIGWKELSKEEKQEFIQKNQQYVQDEKTLMKLLDLADRLRVSAAEASKQASSIASNTVTIGLNDAKSIYEDKIRNLELDEEHKEYGLGRKATQAQKNIVELEYAEKELTLAQERLNEVEKQYGKDNVKYKERLVAVDKLKQKVEELKDVYGKAADEIKTMFADAMVDGGDFSNMWKKIWKDFERDAWLSILGVKHEMSSLGTLLSGNNNGGLLGLFSGLFGGSGRPSGVQGPLKADGSFATGGIIKKEMIARIGEDGEEVAIPVEKNTGNSLALLQYTAEKLGVSSKGTVVVPTLSNPDLANSTTVNVQVKQQENHIRELEKHTELLTNIIGALASSGSNSGQVVVMPVQASDETILSALQRNPSILNDILGSHRSLGYR